MASIAPAEVADHLSALTIQQHIMREQQRFPFATGEFSFLLSAITLSTKKIQAQVRRAGLNNILGEHGNDNVQGERQQKLDVVANRVMIQSLSSRHSVGVIASEEDEFPIVMPHRSDSAKYAVVFDPLDGSSNIDVNVSVGTTFSILRRPDGASYDHPESWVLQPGTEQLGAGYVVYGSSTMMVYTVGNGVHGFTLDPNYGAFVLSHENIRIPEHGTYYSTNEAYFDTYPERYQDYISELRSGRQGKYGSRYIGSMVADIHRTLMVGGVFLYPPTATHPAGKLRLLYEANPIAMIVEQAGGMATDGQQRVLDIQPHDVHQRTPLIVGGRREMELFQQQVNH